MVRVRQFESHRDCPRLLIDVRVDERQLAVKLFVGKRPRHRGHVTCVRCVVCIHGSFMVNRQERQIVLVDLGLNPDGRQVGHVVQRRPFLDVLPLAHVLL